MGLAADVPARKPGLMQRMLARLEAQKKAPQANGAAGRTNQSLPAADARRQTEETERRTETAQSIRWGSHCGP